MHFYHFYWFIHFSTHQTKCTLCMPIKSENFILFIIYPFGESLIKIIWLFYLLPSLHLNEGYAKFQIILQFRPDWSISTSATIIMTEIEKPHVSCTSKCKDTGCISPPRESPVYIADGRRCLCGTPRTNISDISSGQPWFMVTIIHPVKPTPTTWSIALASFLLPSLAAIKLWAI